MFDQKLKIIINKAKERGYYLLSQTPIKSTYDFTRDDGLCLIVNPETEEFTLQYLIDADAKLDSGKLNLFMNDKQFAIQEIKMTKYMYAIKTAVLAPCGENTCENCESYPCLEHFGTQIN